MKGAERRTSETGRPRARICLLGSLSGDDGVEPGFRWAAVGESQVEQPQEVGLSHCHELFHFALTV